MKRNFYLEDIPLEAAQAAFSAALRPLQLWQALDAETIPLAKANGRVTANPIWAKLSSPHYHASAMDGYAIRAADSNSASENNPVYLTLIEDREMIPQAVQTPALAVNTGHALPRWANAVIMIEHTQQAADNHGRAAIEIRAAVPPWHHVRPLGEDMVATELVLPANHTLRPVDLGAIAGAGHATVSVYRRPKVAIIPTGSELVEVESAVSTPLTPGQIIEYNSIVLAAQIENWGGLPTRWPIVPDEFDAIRDAVHDAAQTHDLILLNAGSSAGSEDYTAHVVESLGTLIVHGVAVRPGHPVVLGIVNCQLPTDTLQLFVPIIGVPGYPVSAALTGEIFVEPLMATWRGQPPYKPPTIKARLTRKIASHTGDDDFVRVAVGRVGNRIMATPISRGAGVITSLVRADGIVRIPRFSEGEDAGSAVTVHLYRSPAQIERTVLMLGSHDLTIDLLAQFLAQRDVRLASANVGSLGGLVALRRGEAHLAGSHLLDPETGQYNDRYVKQYLPGQPVTAVSLVEREQGWIVAPHNPKQIRGWNDAARSDVQLVNRQRGAGTRVLLDYELKQRGIDPQRINGYEREEYTHLAVAAAVASGSADLGLGVRAAAQALELDFVPLASERYELIIPDAQLASSLVQTLLETLQDEAFHTAVSQLPGYDVNHMGQKRTIAPS